ncbi:MAG: hypothetical protein F6K54_30295 [Okeania sp. SIO3B5]|uniref:hypothetical protein n=1 Tax=Okeania sp. SIO3B5 TaxID=2607811 RepID=UPI0013FEEFDF|nr:hypothetical protein [Okeania sp. SIO3B5]NEO56987.1 hypothetical protein [Okeania sp. SIO3B5]
MVVDNLVDIRLSKDPLTFVLHPIATFGMVCYYESLITFLFVHLSTFACGIVPGNWYFPAFRPASEIDVQSLLRGLCCQPNNRASGISPPR